MLIKTGMDTREAGKIGGSRRASNMTPAQRSDGAQKASRAFWDSMTPEERSAEIKRRWAKRRKK